jgi:uncharacterized protein
MAYENNKFCWHGVISTDTDQAKAFYPNVLGWQVQTTQMGDQEATMFAGADGVARAHLMAPPMDGVPSHWDNYLRVDDVDARTAAAAANGGSIVVPPNDIPPGRFSVVTSPSGAMICLFHEADEAASTNAGAGHGSIHWVELHSKDLDADIAWIKSTLGLGTQEMPMPEGKYFILTDGEEQVGGAMVGMNPDAPSMWLTWVQVPNIDEVVELAATHGGQALAPTMDMPGIGRMAVLMDPTGGVFGAITPAPRG